MRFLQLTKPHIGRVGGIYPQGIKFESFHISKKEEHYFLVNVIKLTFRIFYHWGLSLQTSADVLGASSPDATKRDCPQWGFS